ncbi:uncharacterized protein LOC106013658 [Aplysia californica]|uniref:Uncharacterized protein LOC106013658 n=1 Tax=Aplysia californica TaxID=6500 RepID=A0ABM1AD44_APLCA|nr:uncharacterized protein LOC106013658 [Aplysia californica]
MEDSGDDDGTNQFTQMTKTQLVDYLGARGLSTTGTKLALIGRAFVAWETGVTVKSSTETFQNQLKEDYKTTLKKFSIPDPVSLPPDSWSEKVTKWPPVDMGKIFMYLLSTSEYNRDYIGKYKTQKAYSYFASKFVGTILWAQVPDDCDRCFLTSEVTPSQSVRGDTHKQWILLRNTGEILTSMCSCTAGMCSTCNHVIAVLYKVEFAISNHLNSESCTETSCAWNKCTKKTVEPKRVEEMELRSDSAPKYSSSDTASESRKRRLTFDPRRDGENKKNPEGSSQFQTKSLEPISMPPTMLQAAEQCIAKNSGLDDKGLSEKFGESLVYTRDQCKLLEETTRQQGSSTTWHNHRKGRITGSNIKRVVRKIEELNRKVNAATTSLTHHLLSGGPDLSHIPAIKWGRDSEESGLQEFEASMHSNHLNVTLRRAGLYVKSTHPYIGASPDAVLHCDCHGLSTVELKCPFKLKGKNIVDNYAQTDFLCKGENGDLELKRDHAYYYQVQTQLAVTGFTAGFFCVSSLDGKPFIIQVLRDDKLWEDIQQKLVVFFKGYISKHLLGLKEFLFCPTCDNLILEPRECQQEGDNSVCCDSCNLWHHWTCQDYSKDKDTFLCSFCTGDNME